MGQHGAKLRRWHDPQTGQAGYIYFCPGCNSAHSVATESPTRPVWEFNGNLDKPTFRPSILAFHIDPETYKRETLCHHFVTDGRVEFCADSPHELAGKTAPLPGLPKWLRDGGEKK